MTTDLFAEHLTKRAIERGMKRKADANADIAIVGAAPPPKRTSTQVIASGRKAAYFSDVDITACIVEKPVKNSGGTISMWAHPPNSMRGDIEFQLAKRTDATLPTIVWYYPPMPGNSGMGTIELEIPMADQRNFLSAADEFTQRQIYAAEKKLKKLKMPTSQEIVNDWYKCMLRESRDEGGPPSMRVGLGDVCRIRVTENQPTDSVLTFREGTIDDLKGFPRVIPVLAFKSISVRSEARRANLVVRAKTLMVFPPDGENPRRESGGDVDLGDDVRVEIVKSSDVPSEIACDGGDCDADD